MIFHELMGKIIADIHLILVQIFLCEAMVEYHITITFNVLYLRPVR